MRLVYLFYVVLVRSLLPQLHQAGVHSESGAIQAAGSHLRQHTSAYGTLKVHTNLHLLST